MSVDTLINILIGSQAGLFGLLVWHLFKDRDSRIDIAAIRQSVASIAHEIGDHERGMRGQLHEHANHLTRNTMDIEVLKRKADPR